MTSATIHTAIAAAEVWVPTQRQQWELVEGCYSDDESMIPERSIRNETTGLLAAVVREQNAVICEDLEAELALRGASAEPIDGMIGIPCFTDGTLSSVLVLAIANHGGKAGIEIWAGRNDSYELCLKQGLHPGLDRFAAISRHVHMPHGSGLPGRAWSSGLPQLMRSIGSSRRFLRSSGADSQGLDTGLALPLIEDHRLHGVVCLLSSAESPLARSYEIFVPENVNGAARLRCLAVHHGNCKHLAEASQRLTLQPGQDLVGRVWAERRPIVWHDLANDGFKRHEAALQDGISCALAFPVCCDDDISAVACLYW